MIFDYDKYFCSGCQKEVPRHHRCGPTFREQIDELRSRLQALEQNAIPAGSAKQEPRDWHLLRMLPDGPVLQVFWDQPVAQRAKELFEGAAAPRYEIIRVREVLDD